MERQFGFSRAITVQCGYWVVPPWVSVCVCGGINSTKIKTIDNWESKKMLKYWADWVPIFPSKCYYPAHANNWAGTATLISHQHWASHSCARWTKWTAQDLLTTCVHLEVFPLQEAHATAPFQHAVIFWPIPELKLSHIKPTPQHRTKSALCAPGTAHRKMEPWSWGYGKTDSWCFWSTWTSEKPHSL